MSSFNITTARGVDAQQAETDFDNDWHWAETAVTATVATLAALFVSSLAVLMYLA